MSNTMRMFSGQLVDPLDLKISDIRADDICWALAHICRYGGHCHRDYSVGEHTLWVYRRVPSLGSILHDASEAYLGDMPTPLKRRMPEFIKAERRAQQVIAVAFGMEPGTFLREIECGDTKLADLDALHYEQAFLWEPTHLQSKAPSKELVAAQLYCAIKEHTPRWLDLKSLALDKHTIFG
jgi:hypothetical protein